MTYLEWEILDRMRLSRIIQLYQIALIYFNIEKETIKMDLMSTLDKYMKKITNFNKLFLMKHLFIMKM